MIFIGNNSKVMLPDLLLFHGLNKTIDVYLNIDFELAYQMLLDFKKTHQRNLKGNYYLKSNSSI